MTRTAALRASTLFVFLSLFLGAGFASQATLAGPLVIITSSLCALLAFFALATPTHPDFRMQRVVVRPHRRF